MASLGSNTYGKKLLRLISWSHWFTFFNICAAIVLSSSYVFTESHPETILGQGYLIATWLSHMAFLTVVAFVLIVFPVTLLLPFTRFIRGYSSCVFTLILAALVLDIFTYQALGYHLNASSTEQIIQLIHNTIEKDSQGFWTTAIASISLILLFQLVVSNYAWKHIQTLQQAVFAKYVMGLLLIAFVTSHLIHVWADAHLDYDVLQQDTLFPLSYPTTAKTLLNKYGLFNEEHYLENKSIPVSFNNDVAPYPVLNDSSCSAINAKPQTTIIILNKNSISQQQIDFFNQRNSHDVIRFGRHIDSASTSNAWFNLFYSLPSIYQNNILMQYKSPVLFQRIRQLGLSSNLTIINDTNTTSELPTWLPALFDETQQLKNSSTIIFGQHLKTLPKGLHVYYFDTENNDQLNIFTDALLLSEQRKKTPSAIWISALGNEDINEQSFVKPALFILPNSPQRRLRILTSQMDVVPTLMQQWLSCDLDAHHYSTGTNVYGLTDRRIIANSTATGLIVFEKDKSIFVNEEGQFKGYSRQLKAPIDVKPNHPLMINGVKNIQQYVGH